MNRATDFRTISINRMGLRMWLLLILLCAALMIPVAASANWQKPLPGFSSDLSLTGAWISTISYDGKEVKRVWHVAHNQSVNQVLFSLCSKDPMNADHRNVDDGIKMLLNSNLADNSGTRPVIKGSTIEHNMGSRLHAHLLHFELTVSGPNHMQGKWVVRPIRDSSGSPDYTLPSKAYRLQFHRLIPEVYSSSIVDDGAGRCSITLNGQTLPIASTGWGAHEEYPLPSFSDPKIKIDMRTSLGDSNRKKMRFSLMIGSGVTPGVKGGYINGKYIPSLMTINKQGRCEYFCDPVALEKKIKEADKKLAKLRETRRYLGQILASLTTLQEKWGPSAGLNKNPVKELAKHYYKLNADLLKEQRKREKTNYNSSVTFSDDIIFIERYLNTINDDQERMRFTQGKANLSRIKALFGNLPPVDSKNLIEQLKHLDEMITKFRLEIVGTMPKVIGKTVSPVYEASIPGLGNIQNWDEELPVLLHKGKAFSPSSWLLNKLQKDGLNVSMLPFRLKPGMKIEVIGKVDKQLRDHFLQLSHKLYGMSEKNSDRAANYGQKALTPSADKLYYEGLETEYKKKAERQRVKGAIAEAVHRALAYDNQVNEINYAILQFVQGGFPERVELAESTEKAASQISRKIGQYAKTVQGEVEKVENRLASLHPQYIQCLVKSEEKDLQAKMDAIHNKINASASDIEGKKDIFVERSSKWWHDLKDDFFELETANRNYAMGLMDIRSFGSDNSNVYLEGMVKGAKTFDELNMIHDMANLIKGTPKALKAGKELWEAAAKKLAAKRAVKIGKQASKMLDEVVDLMGANNRLFGGDRAKTLSKMEKWFKHIRSKYPDMPLDQVKKAMSAATSEKEAARVLRVVGDSMKATAKELGAEIDFMSVGTGSSVDKSIAGSGKLPDPAKWNFGKNDYDVSFFLHENSVKKITEKMASDPAEWKAVMEKLGYPEGTKMSNLPRTALENIAEQKVVQTMEKNFKRMNDGIPALAYDNMYFRGSPSTAVQEEVLSHALVNISDETKNALLKDKEYGQLYVRKLGNKLAKAGQEVDQLKGKGLSPRQFKEQRSEIIQTAMNDLPEAVRNDSKLKTEIMKALNAETMRSIYKGKLSAWNQTKVLEDDAFLTFGGKRLVEIMQQGTGNPAYRISANRIKEAGDAAEYIKPGFRLTAADGYDIVSEMGTFFHDHGSSTADKVAKYYLRGSFGKLLSNEKLAPKLMDEYLKLKGAPETRMVMLAKKFSKEAGFNAQELKNMKQALLMKYADLKNAGSAEVKKMLRGVTVPDSAPEKKILREAWNSDFSRWQKAAKQNYDDSAYKMLETETRARDLARYRTMSRLKPEVLQNNFGVSEKVAKEISLRKHDPIMTKLRHLGRPARSAGRIIPASRSPKKSQRWYQSPYEYSKMFFPNINERVKDVVYLVNGKGEKPTWHNAFDDIGGTPESMTQRVMQMSKVLQEKNENLEQNLVSKLDAYNSGKGGMGSKVLNTMKQEAMAVFHAFSSPAATLAESIKNTWEYWVTIDHKKHNQLTRKLNQLHSHLSYRLYMLSEYNPLRLRYNEVGFFGAVYYQYDVLLKDIYATQKLSRGFLSKLKAEAEKFKNPQNERDKARKIAINAVLKKHEEFHRKHFSEESGSLNELLKRVEDYMHGMEVAAAKIIVMGPQMNVMDHAIMTANVALQKTLAHKDYIRYIKLFPPSYRMLGTLASWTKAARYEVLGE